jgi:hypothetical protein
LRLQTTAFRLLRLASFNILVETYASEVNKLNSVWHQFDEADLAFKPHPRSSTVQQIIEHELLSERRFFGEFLGLPEVPADEVLPESRTPQAFAARMGPTIARTFAISR